MTPVVAVGIVCFRQDRVLLIRRAKPPYAGGWSLPGGRVEGGERTRQAALRELFEETGLTAGILELIDVVDGIFSELDQHYVLIEYLAGEVVGDPVAGDDALDACFQPMSQIDDLIDWPETRRIISKAYAR